MDRSGTRPHTIAVDTRANSTNIGYILIFVLVLGLAAGSFAFLNILSGADNPAGYNTDITANINDDGTVGLDLDGVDGDDGTITIIADNGNETTIQNPGNAGGGNSTNLCEAIGEFQNATLVNTDDETGASAVVGDVSFEEPKCTGEEEAATASGDSNVSIAIG